MRAALFALLLMGCPTATTHRDAGPDASVSFDDAALIDAGVQFCATYATARCALRERCHALQPTQRSNCEAEQRAFCHQRGAVFTGRSVLPQAAVTECLDTLATTGDCNFECSPWDIGGNIGEACIFGFRCRESICTNDGNVCSGCAPFTALGAFCGSQSCNPHEAFCDQNVSHVCRPLRDAGETCAGLGECRDGTPCLLSDAGVRQCGFVEGAPCNFEECGPGAFCSGFLFNGFGVCTRQRALGESCSGADFFQCGIGATCLDGVCARLGASNRTLGQECRNTADCVMPLRCIGDGAPRFCSEPFDAGAACVGGECGPGMKCACFDGQCLSRGCVPLGDVGDSCELGSDILPCFDQLSCVLVGSQHLCVPKGSPGDDCVSPLDCAAPGLCVRGVCTLPSEAGGHCDSPAECNSFACDFNTRICVDCQ